ncbi:MAG: DUF4198 domain-containing protein [Synergistaceae bacterium]|jgi:uncharacterized GH25 family protein|nr:DUF4198 domain-containing protein [Synergistaceae bacterium]
MRKIYLAAAMSLALFTAPAFAHELILKPASFSAAVGVDLAVELQSTHVFIVKEEVEDISTIKAGAVLDGKLTESVLKPNGPDLRIDFSVKIPEGKSSTIIIANKAGEVWSVTPDGSKQGTRKSFEDQGIKVARASRTDKFAKAIVNASEADENFAAVVGQELEIVPVTNPASVKTGQYFKVKVLFNGQPATLPVFATYDGFVKEYQNTYAYYTESDSEGIANIKITTPGIWIIRVSKDNDPGVPGEFDTRSIRSILTVPVK